ncbi:uncharacterized protein LOC111354039 [Spodoptera litura]|uniref:Uncharacterized protein LOC111354039 n=1 Tax=Spodoptera litura TaxID=69820 RepID=A0A9J7IPS4_SPOLT|nr:uncharacterized protein LOC111354039 [Spodoptera litura]
MVDIIGEVINKESGHLIKTDTLRKVINNVKIQIGQPLTNPSYTTVSDFYINQWLGRHISLKLNIEDMPGMYIIPNTFKSYELPQETTDIIAILESEKEFDDLCAEFDNYNIHWFVGTNKNSNSIVWKKTRGKLERLLKYIDRDFEENGSSNQPIQPQTLKDIAEKVVVINAEPGMGKSTFLTHLAIQTKLKYPNLWISKINLSDHVDQFSQWKQNKKDVNMEEVVKFLYKIFLNKVDDGTTKRKYDWDQVFCDNILVDASNKICFQPSDNEKELVDLDLLEINLFNHFYNNNQVALLFDGFDEICPDYADEVLHMLRILKSSNVAHLWVTSRSYNVLEQLESVLGTFSFTLLPLGRAEQLSFLEKIWSVKLALWDAQHNVKNSVSYFYNIINITLNLSSFTNSPLNLYMVSEIFKDFFRYFYDPMVKKFSNFYMQKVMETFNLIFLYETFVEMKFFKIRFGEKKHFMCFKDPAMRRMVENERKTFLDIHKKVGAYYILSKTVVADLFTEEEINEVHEFIESVKTGEEKSGIIQRIVGDKPQFIHKSFAEYFATEYIFEKFQSDSCPVALQKYVINLIFITDNGGVRRFINNKLIKGKKLFDLSTGTSYICSVFGSLVTQNFLPTNSFFVAGEEYLRHIGMFMLICGSSSRDYRNMSRYCKLFQVKCSAQCDLCTKKLQSLHTNLRVSTNTLFVDKSYRK